MDAVDYFRENVRRMAGYVPGEQPQAGKFIKLNTNENPYPSSPAVARAIHAALEAGLARYPDPLASAFRSRAADVLGVAPEQILCGNGSDDALTIVTRALVGERQWVRYPTPSYVLYRTLAELQGAQWEEVAFQRDWSLPARFAAPRDGLKLAYLPNPNSPTGTMLSRRAVAELADALPCPLLLDEAYVDFADFHCLDLVEQCPKLIVCRSLSKSYALAGLRFGFLVAQPQLVEQLMKVKDSYNCDALSIAGATAAIDDQPWRETNRARIVATRARFADQLAALGFSVLPSQANFLWCTHPEQPAQALYERLKHSRILVRYMKYPNSMEGLRITVGTDDQVDACLAALQPLV